MISFATKSIKEMHERKFGMTTANLSIQDKIKFVFGKIKEALNQCTFIPYYT